MAAQNYVRDRVSKLGVLLVITVIVQLIYASFVRPTAEQWLEEQRQIARTTPGYTPARSIWVIIQDPEQQATWTHPCMWPARRSRARSCASSAPGTSCASAATSSTSSPPGG